MKALCSIFATSGGRELRSQLPNYRITQLLNSFIPESAEYSEEDRCSPRPAFQRWSEKSGSPCSGGSQFHLRPRPKHLRPATGKFSSLRLSCWQIRRTSAELVSVREEAESCRFAPP